MTVSGGLTVNRADEVKHFDDAVGSEVKHRAYAFDDFVVRDGAGAEGVDHDGGRLGDADGVRDLHFAAFGEAGGDDVFRHIAACISGASIHFRGVFAGEGTAAVVCGAAVGIDDDFAPGQAAVAHRPTDNEFAGRVDVVFGVLVEPFGGQDFVDDELAYRFLQVFLRDVRIVLGGEDDGVDTGDFVVFVAEGDLRFGIRTQPRQHAVAAHFRLPLNQAVRVGNRRRHQGRCFVAGIAEHQALVASTLFAFFFTVYALGDIGRLLADDVQHGTGCAIEANIGAVVADVGDGLAHNLFQINPSGGGDFAGDHRHAGFDEGFAGDTGIWILRDDGV